MAVIIPAPMLRAADLKRGDGVSIRYTAGGALIIRALDVDRKKRTIKY